MNLPKDLSANMRSRGRIRVMGKSDTKDAAGQYPVEPQTVAEVWCQVVPQTGGLLAGRPAETELARTTHKILLRYRQGIRPDMWFEVGGERYDILYVMDPGLRHIWLECFCEVSFDGTADSRDG